MAQKDFQMSLFNMKSPKIFGASLLKASNPKTKRPISTKHAMHLVLKSKYTKGSRSFLLKANREAIDCILKSQAKRWGIRLYRYENVGNHLHILLKTGHRRWLAGYLRSVTGLIARHILRSERGCGKSIQFWEARPFSRVVTWGRAYKAIHRYFDKNRMQAVGFNWEDFSSELGQTLADTG